MKTRILLICLLIAINSFAQNNYVKSTELLLFAKRALENKDAQKALNYYEDAFKLVDHVDVSDYLYAAKSAAEVKNESALKRHLIKAIEEHKISVESLKNLSDNKFYQQILDTLLPDYEIHLANFYHNIKNPVVYHKLQKLLNRDQVTRKIGDYYLGVDEKEQEAAFNGYLKAQAEKDTAAQKKYRAILWPKSNKVHEDYKTKVISYTDSLNVAELIKITKKYGWQKDGWLILWHQRGSYGKKNWIWNYFKPVIDKEIAEGNVSPFFWVVFEDIASIIKTGKSIYGYHPGKVNPKTVNTNRKQIGLPVLTDKEIKQRNTRRDKGRMF